MYAIEIFTIFYNYVYTFVANKILIFVLFFLSI